MGEEPLRVVAIVGLEELSVAAVPRYKIRDVNELERASLQCKVIAMALYDQFYSLFLDEEWD